MKVLIVLLLLPISVMAQKNHTDSLKSEYSEVVDAPGMTAAQLHANAKMHVATVFKSAKDVVQMDDNFTVVCKGTTKVEIKALGFAVYDYVNFTYTIQSKDNKYRYSINNFILNLKTSTGYRECPLADDICRTLTPKQWASIRNQVAETCTLVASSLKNSMLKDQSW